MVSSNQEKDFAQHCGLHETLDLAIDWIGHNMDPEAVFSSDQLQVWAENNDFIKK